jgi:predicted SnoaL-like aldol condensation-catalyzing enzyme
MSVLKIDFDKLQQAHWSEEEQKNVAIISDFIQKLMNDHDFDYIKKKYGAHRYLQHNLTMSDGITGVIETVEEIVKRSPEYCYDVKYIMASKDMVMTHTHMTTKAKNRGNKNKGFIITDRWKLVNGEIVEHWDAIQPISGLFRFIVWISGRKLKNANPLF